MHEEIVRIEYCFPLDWILDIVGPDVEASAEHYAELLQARLARVFPDTAISVRPKARGGSAMTLINGRVPGDVPGEALAYQLVGYIEDAAHELYQDFDAWVLADKNA